MHRRPSRIAALLIAALLLAACSSGDRDTSSAGRTSDDAAVVVESSEAESYGAESPDAESYGAESYGAVAGQPSTVHDLVPANGAPYADVHHRNPGVNPFIDTRDDQLSTFAVDVDTGSYTIARRYLGDGHVPERDSVRVEEYVNFFAQGYAPPTSGAFAIHTDGASTPFVQNERYRLLRVGLATAVPEPGERPDAVLTFVVDISGSMEMENRLGLVKESLSLLVEQLRPTDTVAIVVYGSDAEVALRPTPVAERGEILRVIDGLRTEGSTNAEAGLALGYRVARDALRPGAINRVVLASDGVANTGTTEASGILDRVRDDAAAGIQLVTLGFGMGNYNDVLMERLANDGDGFYAYIDDRREAERLFLHELTATLHTVALDTKVQVEFDPATVDRYRLIGFENRDVADERFRDDTVDAGAVGAGHTVTALYEVALAPEAAGPLGTVRLRWTDPTSREPVEMAHVIDGAAVRSTFAEADPHLQLAAVVAAFGEVLRESTWARHYDLHHVAEHGHVVSRALDHPDVRELLTLVEAAAALSG
jgi:Ca-activated chloride channel homolog